MFEFDLSDNLKRILQKLAKRDPKRTEIINKKIKEIVSGDHAAINNYKNLRYNLREFKRVHIDSSFVLIFKVDLEDNFILFVDLDHHDQVYR